MNLLLIAYRILRHERARNAPAISGIFIAILLIFHQLGFYASVPRSGMLFYDAMRFDILLTSKSYVFEGQPFSFPRRRLYQALSLPGVVRAMPVYHNIGRWLNAEARLARDVFVVGFNPSDPVFNVDDIQRQTATNGLV